MEKRHLSRNLGWLAGALLLAAPMLGRAEDAAVGDKAFSIGPRATYSDPKDSDEGKWYGGAQTRLRLTPAFGLEGSVDYRRNIYDNDTIIKSYPVQASVLAYLTPQAAVSPFILGGAGWYFTRVEGPQNYRDTQNRFGLHAGGGLEVKLTELLSIDGSYRYVWLESVDSKDLNALDKEYEDEGSMITAALNFHF